MGWLSWTRVFILDSDAPLPNGDARVNPNPTRHPHAETIATAHGGLDNPTHEAFAQKVAQGINAAQAYRDVTGNQGTGAKVIASRWLTNVNIKRRVKDLQAHSDSLGFILFKLFSGRIGGRP